MRVSFYIYVSLVTLVICIGFDGLSRAEDGSPTENPADSAEDFPDEDMESPPDPAGSIPDSEVDDDEVAVDSEDVPVVKFEPLDFDTPDPKGSHHFAEGFKDTDALQKRWMRSKAKKDDVDEVIAKYDGEWAIKLPDNVVLRNDYGLVLNTKARHHAISAKFSKPFDFSQEKPLIVQYDINFQNGQECGGAYVKLLLDDKSVDLNSFNDKTPYSIMFGPDKCGLTSKIHFIVQHKNPHSGKIEEKHSKQPDKSIETYITDKKSHLYTLVVNPDNSYELLIDQKRIFQGNLLETVEPPFVPSKEIEDPDDKKPEDWDDREKISDPEAKKPEDWDETLPEFIPDDSDKKPDGWLDDETEYIPDPEAVKPADWDVDMDGEWEAPKIENPKCKDAPGCGDWKQKKKKNPAYKGVWKAPMITNPAFKGKWKAQKIPNPEYFEDTKVFRTLLPIGAVGLELWSMSDGIHFDNFIVTDERSVAETYAAETWYLKTVAETKLANKSSFFGSLIESANDKPWLWAVYVLVILLPIVLITYFCCTGGKSDELDPKKTDEVQPDDDFDADDVPLLHNPDAEAEPDSSGGGSASSSGDKPEPSPAGGSSANGAKPATRKSDLEASEDEEEEEEEEEEDEEEEEEEKSSSNSPKASPGKSPRRRARKD